MLWAALFDWSGQPGAMRCVWVVHLFMNLVVPPRCRVPHAQNAMTLASRIYGVLAVVLLIGLTISLLVRWSAAAAEKLAETSG